jgi:hypothetical protein
MIYVVRSKKSRIKKENVASDIIIFLSLHRKQRTAGKKLKIF